MKAKVGYVYIMTTINNTVLYTGVTSSLKQRVWEHINKKHPTSFTAKYNCNKLVYFKEFDSILAAIEEEKRIKSGNRKHKIDLITSINEGWKDLWDVIVDW